MQKLALLFLLLPSMSVAGSDGSYINWLNPLYFNTAFNQSGKVLAITMPCGSAGLIDCETAAERLHTLTDSPACRDNFFIALIDQSDFAADQLPEPGLWLQFSFLAGIFGRQNIPVSFPTDTTQVDCHQPYDIMMSERARYLP